MLPLRACCAYRWTSQVPHHDRACRQAFRQQRSGFTVCWAAHLAAAAVNVLQHLLHAGHRGVQLVGLCLDGLRQSLHPGSKPMQLLWGMECRGLALCGSWSPAAPLGPRRFSQPRELSASRVVGLFSIGKPEHKVAIRVAPLTLKEKADLGIGSLLSLLCSSLLCCCRPPPPAGPPAGQGGSRQLLQPIGSSGQHACAQHDL